jgi:hypothetical protein
MRKSCSGSEALSEIISVILILCLLTILSFVVYGMIFGSIMPYMKETSRIAASAGTVTIPLDANTSTSLLYTLPMSGDRQYSLKGQEVLAQGYPVVSFVVRDPNGTSFQVQPGALSANANQYVTPLYLYQRSDTTFRVTDSKDALAAAPAQIRPISPKGTWTIVMVDSLANVPLTEMQVNVGSDINTVNPLMATTVWSNNGEYVNTSGYHIPFTNYGVVPITGPRGLFAYSFNGTGAYIQGTDNPDVTFTGDMSISLWMQPTAAGVNGYHEIAGKGSDGDVNDNYDLFLIDQKLWFEWTDKNTGQMYHIMTDNAMPWGASPDWNYVTFTVNSGVPAIYYDGSSVPFTYYSGNTVASPVIAPVAVNLNPDSNPITIGKQNYAGNEMYYAGNMSMISYYNRALSASEIQNNNNNYLT